ncbi:MAG: CYTH domain-containing protein [Prolixibacteraceae bacterium]|nr:CYTH domain-containing protein [Prolixibacteraceae bacterium]
MAKEIERKFLVDIDKWGKRGDVSHIMQGYIFIHPQKVIRIRIDGKKAFLTIKGNLVGITRDEYEYPIPYNDACQLLKLCEGDIVEKNRYVLEYAGKKWEIDAFFGPNEGLVIAEVELERCDEKIELPNWVTVEVSQDNRYYNFNLSRHPFSQWQ